MSYSQEEIEQKRLLALQRKKQAQVKNTSFNSTVSKNRISSANSHATFNQNKSTNTVKPFERYEAKNTQDKPKFGYHSNTPKFNKHKERFNPMSTKKFFGQKSRITGKCYMISDDRFTLETSSYFPPLIETLKTIPSRSYGSITKYLCF